MDITEIRYCPKCKVSSKHLYIIALLGWFCEICLKKNPTTPIGPGDEI